MCVSVIRVNVYESAVVYFLSATNVAPEHSKRTTTQLGVNIHKIPKAIRGGLHQLPATHWLSIIIPSIAVLVIIVPQTNRALCISPNFTRHPEIGQHVSIFVT